MDKAIQEAFTGARQNVFSTYLDHPFRVSLGRGELEMKTLKEWNPEAFLKEAFGKGGRILAEQVRNTTHQGHRDAKLLARIYSQLNEQVNT